MQHHQRAPVRYFVKSDQIPSRTGAKRSFKGIMCMADEAEMWLILLIPEVKVMDTQLCVGVQDNNLNAVDSTVIPID
jgi:hypothetical protein